MNAIDQIIVFGILVLQYYLLIFYVSKYFCFKKYTLKYLEISEVMLFNLKYFLKYAERENDKAKSDKMSFKAAEQSRIWNSLWYVKIKIKKKQ